MLIEIIWRSFYVSSLGVLLGFICAVPLAYWAAKRVFWSKTALIITMQALMAMPPVVAGLGLYMIFRPQAIFGGLAWLYSAQIMIIAQFVLVFPIIFSLCHDGFRTRHQRLGKFFSAYPSNAYVEFRAYMRDARLGLATAAIVAFGRALGEVGAVMIVGGNIAGRTEVMTTVIIEETGKGNLELAMKMGLILLALALFVSLLGVAIRQDWRSSYHG